MRGAWNKIAVLCLVAILMAGFFHTSSAANADVAFKAGVENYEAARYENAATNFNEAVSASLAAGTLQNLGNAEWQSGHTGPAVLAWERAQWLDSSDAHARNNLRFARKERLLEAPDLSWYELCSTWLPVNAWPWLAAFSFWLAAAMIVLPIVFGWKRAGWHQALASAGFAIFLLTLPAMYGVHTRSKIGIVQARDAALRLTPTSDAQTIVRLAAGEVARVERERGHYLFVRTSTSTGWIERGQFGLISRMD